VIISGLCETVTAVYRPVSLRLERYTCVATAIGADGSEVFPRPTGGGFSVVAAGFAALRLILETALVVKLLLSACEYELFAAFLTN